MSEALTPEAPETDSIAPSVEVTAPEDGTAVADGSAGGAAAKTVDASRFNGLMSAHQRTLADLESERARNAALEARINSQEEIPEVADDAILARLDQMEERAQRAEREAALSRALAQYPDAAPFADLIVGSNAEDIENVAAAIAERAATLKGTGIAPAPVVEGGDPVITPTTEPPVQEDAPVIGGGHSAPGEPSAIEAVSAALSKGDWAAYWQAKSGPAAQANLG